MIKINSLSISIFYMKTFISLKNYSGVASLNMRRRIFGSGVTSMVADTATFFTLQLSRSALKYSLSFKN